MEQQSTYRQIIKATSIFGGVQAFNIIVSIIRSKFVAILLGPAGFGILDLLNSTIDIIGRLTNFGLGISAVKDIALAYTIGDNKRIGIVLNLIRKIVWITGLAGLILTVILSTYLSQLIFGNSEYSIAFIWLSITLLINQLTNGQLVILQGLRKLNYLAKANLSGSFIGLFITLPLYYFLNYDGIVPGIIGTALISLLMSWYFSRNIKVEKNSLTISQAISQGKGMLKMGFLISLSGLLTMGASYIVRIFISKTGGIEQVGLYNAGFAIINTYVGLLFNAMATDYYPRLSAVAHDNKKCNKTINEQAEIGILVLAPILIIFLVFINNVVIILYSKQFIAISDMIYWAALGMFFKTGSWSISFIFLAKGASKLFFLNELIANILALSLNLIGYHHWGLTGLGISFTVGYIAYIIQVYIVCKLKFSFSFESKFLKLFAVQFSLAIACFMVVSNMSQLFINILGICLIITSLIYSILELDKRISLKTLLKSRKTLFSLHD